MSIYELDEGGMRKFYRMERAGTSVHLHWGRIGAAGQKKTLEFATVYEAEDELERQRQRRLKRGYSLVHDESKAHSGSDARASAAKNRLTKSVALTESPRFLFRNPKSQYSWLEQRGAAVWFASGDLGGAEDAPEHVEFGSAQEAKAELERRMGKLLASGFVLDAFDAKRPKAVRKKTPAKAALPQRERKA